MLDWKYTPKAKQQTTPAEEPIETKVVAEPEETPEGFASKNAKTITFTVMLVLFLVFFGPISVFTIYRQMSDTREYKGAVMTEADLVTLGRMGEGLTAAQVRTYARTESESEGRKTYVVELDDYILQVVEDKASGQLMICLLTARTSGDNIDIRYDDVEAFLASH